MTDAVERFEVMLEKKGRGRGFALSRPWTLRTFRLTQQTLMYFDGDKLKGEISMKDSVSAVTDGAESEGKEFPFYVLTTGSRPEKLMLNASSDLHRQKCIEIFNRASKNPNWKLQETPPPPPPKPQPEQKEYEKAAAAAVVSAMAADAEKKRLEEEARRLEEERQKQVTEAAAAVLAEQEANAKLKAAKEAEEQQKREQVIAHARSALLLRLLLLLLVMVMVMV